MADENWHTLTVSEIERKLGTSLRSGLAKEEVARRLESYGANELPAGKVDSIYAIFLRQFQSPLIYVLLVASVVVFFMGEYVDGALIVAVLIFNAVAGSFQEGKAQNTLLALKRFSETNAVVIRGGEEMVISDKEVVPGDIVVLQEGEKVPADSRVIESRTMLIDEAALTGESGPVHKEEGAMDSPELKPPEQKNMVFKGTNVVSGNGRAMVVATGVNTVIGKISKVVAAIDTEIPLKKDIRWLSKIIVYVITVISAALFIFGIYEGRPLREMFATVVSLAVSIIPEGLPVVLTVILATGVWRMAKKQALVKKLQAVEALGQAKIIAVDKTGTITKNELVIREIYAGGNTFTIGGVGYEPSGEIKIGETVVNSANHEELLLAGKMAAFCANARAIYLEEDKVWRVAGDPTEAAMAVFGEKVGFRKVDLENESPLAYEIPFDYKTKYHATAHKTDKGIFVTVAGAPEAVLEMCSKSLSLDKNEDMSVKKKNELTNVFSNMSEKGLRTVAFAFKEVRSLKIGNTQGKFDLGELIFAGFYGMEDSLRPEVPEAVIRAKEAGMKVVMITGDHKLTAMAIAKQAGIWSEGDKILTGAELDMMHDEALAQEIEGVTVFARVTPEHKMKIIEAYRRRKEIVAMTGDGVNDALSLVAADLGVAMGKIGTEVAKEAADIVLLDDNFGSIVSAAEEGRSIYKTIKKVILYLFSTSLGELFVIVGALFFGYPLPLLPAHIIWLNFVTDGFQVIAFGFEPKEENLLKEKTRRHTKWIVDGLMARRMIIMAIPMVLGTLYLFEEYFMNDLAKARTIALTALAAFQWINAWNCRSEKKSVLGQSPLTNKFLLFTTALVVVLHLSIIYVEPLQKIMGTVPLSLKEWGIIVLVSLSILVAEEARKAYAAAREKDGSVVA